MAELYFVRHGQSTWNLQRRVQGRAHHPPLTDRGRDQARAAAAVVKELEPRRLISSDQVRAAQTAVIIGDVIGIEPAYDERLREHDHGDLTGMSSDEAVEQWDAGLPESDLGSFDPDRQHGHTGESTRDVARRFAALAADLGTLDGPVVLVSHGSFIQVALAILNAEDLAAMVWRSIGNGDVFDHAGSVVRCR